MKKNLNIILYSIIILLIAAINIISIKKFFDNKKSLELDNIIATNFVSSLVSYNSIKIESHEIIVDNISNTENKDVVVKQPEIEDKVEEKQEVFENKKEVEEIVEEAVGEEVVEKTTEEEKTQIKIENGQNNEEVLLDEKVLLFDGLTEEELVLKLEKSLKNELSGTAVSFVEFYKSSGLDPYLAVAIVLHETGCSWNCSNLVKECYNYGGMKGGENKYKNTSYTCYSSKDEGINAYLNMLYKNYYSKGLTTAELINPKYAASLEWSASINRYIDKIKNK